MATATHAPLEVYLHSEYEPAAEYVNGEILERPTGELNHADWQAAISAWFLNHAKEWNIRVFPELRVQVTQENYRIPDVTVLDRSLPVEQVITHPPIAVFEVLSPEDTVKRLKYKLADLGCRSRSGQLRTVRVRPAQPRHPLRTGRHPIRCCRDRLTAAELTGLPRNSSRRANPLSICLRQHIY
jgi:Putative restriction endonuclease